MASLHCGERSFESRTARQRRPEMMGEWIRCARRGLGMSSAIAAVMALTVIGADAQSVGSASIRGRITDETGAGVPGATVTVSSPSLQLRERTAAAENDGEYQFRSLALGTDTV